MVTIFTDDLSIEASRSSPSVAHSNPIKGSWGDGRRGRRSEKNTQNHTDDINRQVLLAELRASFPVRSHCGARCPHSFFLPSIPSFTYTTGHSYRWTSRELSQLQTSKPWASSTRISNLFFNTLLGVLQTFPSHRRRCDRDIRYMNCELLCVEDWWKDWIRIIIWHIIWYHGAWSGSLIRNQSSSIVI